MTNAERAIDVACDLFAIPMQPQWRETAIANFVAITAAAQLVMDFPLDDEAEPGPVFQP